MKKLLLLILLLICPYSLTAQELPDIQEVRKTGFENIDNYAEENRGKGWFHSAYRRLREDQSPELHHITKHITARWIDWYEMINQCHEQARVLNRCLGARQELFNQFKKKYPDTPAPITHALTQRGDSDLMFFYQGIPLQMPAKAWYGGAGCQKMKDDIDKQWSDKEYVACLEEGLVSFDLKMDRATIQAQNTMNDFIETTNTCLQDVEKLK